MNVTGRNRHEPVRGDARPGVNPRAGQPDPAEGPALAVEQEPRLRVDVNGTVVGGNPAGLRLLESGKPLGLHETLARPTDPMQAESWQRALQVAFARRSPTLCLLGRADGSEAVAIVPDPHGDRASVRFQRTAPCGAASLAAYTAALGLTEAESRVVRLLAQGLSPRQVAEQGGTAESTVRSQVRSILIKSGHAGIRPLLLQLARLPSMD